MRPRSIAHERTPARPESIAATMALYNQDVLDALKRPMAWGFLEHANPERDEQGDER